MARKYLYIIVYSIFDCARKECKLFTSTVTSKSCEVVKFISCMWMKVSRELYPTLSIVLRV